MIPKQELGCSMKYINEAQRVSFSNLYLHVSAAFIHLQLHFKNQFVKWLSGSVIDPTASSSGLAVMQSAAS